AFFFAMSMLPGKSSLNDQIDVLKARDPLRKDNSAESVIVERLLPEERRIIIARQLAEAGWYTTTPVKFGMRIISGACLGAVLTLVAWEVLHFSVGLLPLLLVLFTFVGGYSPFFALNRAMEARKGQIQKALPEFLDMVASTVQAGLALNSALTYAVDAVDGALSEEIKEALSEIRLGRSRADALKAVGERTNHPALRNALRVVTQAEKLGANISKLLNDLAADARHQRLMLVEEMAAKLPVKMVFPMVFFMIPAIVVVIFGAVAANYFATPR
ncbi:MAG: type II secretion system F family protein, partial [Candidatus Cybelea sp.]